MSRKPVPDTFARRLRSLREAAGVSVAALAAAAGVARPTIHALEAGTRRPSLATAVKLAAALNLSLAAFDGVTD